MPEKADWYKVHDDSKHVRQITLLIPSEAEIPSRVKGAFIYRAGLMNQNWAGVTLYIRGEEDDPGPYVFSKANGVVELLKGRETKVTFAFYHYKNGGVLQIFVTVESPEVETRMGYPFITENAHWPENEDSKDIIPALFARKELEIVFLADEGGTPCVGQFGKRITIPEDCRVELVKKWHSLQEYHFQIPQEERDRQLAMAQFERENPIEHNPVLPRPILGDTQEKGVEKPVSIPIHTAGEEILGDSPEKKDRSNWRIALGTFLTILGIAGTLMILSDEGSPAACFGVPIMLLLGIALLYQGITGKKIPSKSRPSTRPDQYEIDVTTGEIKQIKAPGKKKPWILIIVLVIVGLVFACVCAGLVLAILNQGGV